MSACSAGKLVGYCYFMSTSQIIGKGGNSKVVTVTKTEGIIFWIKAQLNNYRIRIYIVESVTKTAT